MRGKGVPAGSVILLTSVSHMQMRGVAGYMADLEAELARVGNSFRGGGGGGCEDKTTVRALIEAGRWLSHSGSQHLQESMKVLSTEIVANGKGGIGRLRNSDTTCPLTSLSSLSNVPG
jgi:hypothetical protein